MKLYRVYGEYGLGHNMVEERLIPANSPDEAMEVFCVEIAMLLPGLWSKIGRNNVRVDEVQG